MPPGFPTNPGLTPPNGIPGGPGGEVTFPPRPGDSPPLPPGLTPGNPGGIQGGTNDWNPPGGSAPNDWKPPSGAPQFDPTTYNSNPAPFPINTNSASKPSPGPAIGTGIAIAAGFGILVLGVLLIAGVIGFILISRSMAASPASGHRHGPRRRRRYDD
jgi:hypothetical protein